MTPAAPSLPVADAMSASLTTLIARLEARDAEIRRLALRIKDLEQQLQARKSPRGQMPEANAVALSLFGEPAVDAAPSSVRAPAALSRSSDKNARGERRPSGPRPLDPSLPREVIVLPDPPAERRVCVLTGVALKPGFTEELEVLARRPAVYYVKQYIRTVWVSPAKSAPMSTPWPADVLTRSRVHASIVAHIAASHFSEHLPYYRLEQQLARSGVSLARSSQVSLMSQLDDLVSPLVEHLKELVLTSGYVHLDATPVDVCDPGRPGKTRSASLWAYRARSPDPLIEGLVWFDYQETKSPVHPGKVLSNYRGVVQTDGAQGLDALGPPERITHLGCWAHARRYVVEGVELGDSRAAGYLAWIDRLFRLEARSRRVVQANPDAVTRAARWRERFSIPLAKELFTRAAREIVTLPPKSALAVALGYLLGQRESLMRCVTTPGAYLDNNGAENAIRPLKLGAKNWLFVGHPNAGPRLANLFTLVENCRQARIDIEAYLIDLVTRLPAHSIRRLSDWLPKVWQSRTNNART